MDYPIKKLSGPSPIIAESATKAKSGEKKVRLWIEILPKINGKCFDKGGWYGYAF